MLRKQKFLVKRLDGEFFPIFFVFSKIYLKKTFKTINNIGSDLGETALAYHLFDLIFLMEGRKDAMENQKLLQFLEQLLVLSIHLLHGGVVRELEPQLPTFGGNEETQPHAFITHQFYDFGGCFVL